MVRIIQLFLIFLLILTTFNLGYAVDFIYRDKAGIWHFDCINTCGPVKVRKSGKCQFFVQSRYYLGLVETCSAEIAASQACGELEFDKPVRSDLVDPSCVGSSQVR